MTEYLPKEVLEGLHRAQAAARRKRRHRMTIHVGDEIYPILQLFDQGFSVDTERAPNLRGLVDIYDGPRHMAQALIVASTEEDGIMRYEFKRNTAASDSAPRDFERRNPEISGLLSRDT